MLEAKVAGLGVDSCLALLRRAFWGLSRRAWWRLPAGVRASRGGLAYGRWAHSQVQRRSSRTMYVWSTFLRNRPALELMRRLIRERTEDSTLSIAVLGCSVGAEVYSILWVLRSARPDLEIVVHGVDISAEVVNVAEAGIYAPGLSDVVGEGIFGRLTDSERQEMFDWNGDTGRVKDWLREGVEWRVDDACDPALGSRIGRHDIVVASNFLCHLDPASADRGLRNIARLVEPGGYIFVSGVDLDVRTNVACDLGWVPITDLLEEIHEADPALREHWPWDWAGLEPLDRRRPDWRTRYATVFRVGGQEDVRERFGPRSAFSAAG
jgi:chemotaxis methyl-accepting protein methylase